MTTPSREEAPELKACPFCGAGRAADALDYNGVWVEKNDHDDPEYHVRCWACGATGRECPNQSDAIKQWNTRADLANREPSEGDVIRMAEAFHNSIFVGELADSGVERELYMQATRAAINAWRNP